MSECDQSLNTHWVCMNINEWVGTAPEHPVSAHERHWVSVNTHIVHMNAIESLLNATHHGVTMREISFVSELNMSWMLVSACEHLWVSIEQPLNACECVLMPMIEYWTRPERLWVCVNSNEWVGTSPEHPLSVHKWLWVSIWKVKMCTSRVVNLKITGTNQIESLNIGIN
jgi:hypothetical protein